MVVQAGAARRLLESRPERSREALFAVEDVGRQALAELRRILGLLREGPGSDPLAPVPGLAQLPALLDRTRASGLAVEVREHGAPRALPPGLDLTAFRVVQEALTNTVKHGGATSAVVQLEWSVETFTLSVVDDGIGAAAVDHGDGHGLLGMHERVSVCGGELEAGPVADGFVVRAVLPLEPEVVPA